MDKNFVKNIMEKLSFPSDAYDELFRTLDVLNKVGDFENIIEKYNNCSIDFTQSIEQVKLLALEENCCVYTAYMLYLLFLTPQLKKMYSENGISEEIFYDTISDLRYKLDECRLVHNACGTFVPIWYKGIFEMKIFALGRLQFELNNIWFDCKINGKYIPKETKILSVHIPRTGKPLLHELVIDSYNQAKMFFRNEFNNEIIFVCNSWLLDPWNRTVLNDNSNLAQFFDDFTIVQTGNYKDYSETWRLFDCLYNNPDELPNNSSLRRAYIERIKSRQPTGYGTGVIVMNI